MGWLSDFFTAREAPNTSPSKPTPVEEARSITPVNDSTSGGQVTASIAYQDQLVAIGLGPLTVRATPTSAMGISTFYGCVKLISNVIASLPYGVYKDEEGGSKRDKSHPLDYLISKRFNRNMSAFIGRRTLMLNYLTRGWAIAEIRRDFMRQPESLHPYPTLDVKMLHDSKTDRYWYYLMKEDRFLSQDDVIVIKDLSFDGNTGVSIVKWQDQVIEIDLLAKAFAKKLYEDGGVMKGFFSTPLGYAKKDEEAAEAFKERLDESFAGKGQKGVGWAVLGDNVTWHKIGHSPVEADTIPLMDRSDREIAKSFGLPLSMLGDTEKATSFGTGIEALYISVTNNVFLPIAVQIEQEIDYKCFRRDEIIDGYTTEHNFKGLLKGDLKAQTEHYQKMAFSGLYTHDEIRALEKRPPYPNGIGSRPIVQSAMVHLDKLDEQKGAKNQQKANGKGNGTENPPAGA